MKTIRCTLNSWGLDAIVGFLSCNTTFLLITYKKIIFHNDSLMFLPLIIISAAFRYRTHGALSSDIKRMTKSQKHELMESQAEAHTKGLPSIRQSHHANVAHQEYRVTLRRNYKLGNINAHRCQILCFQGFNKAGQNLC